MYSSCTCTFPLIQRSPSRYTKHSPMLIFLYSLERVSGFTRCMVKQNFFFNIHLSKYVFHQTTNSKPCTSNKISFYALYVICEFKTWTYYTHWCTHTKMILESLFKEATVILICAVFAPFSRSCMKYLLAAKRQK